jgi:hypothetical protein
MKLNTTSKSEMNYTAQIGAILCQVSVMSSDGIKSDSGAY